MSRFSDRLKSALKERDWSQAYFKRRLEEISGTKIPKQSISYWVNGRNRPREIHYAAIAALLGWNEDNYDQAILRGDFKDGPATRRYIPKVVWGPTMFDLPIVTKGGRARRRENGNDHPPEQRLHDVVETSAPDDALEPFGDVLHTGELRGGIAKGDRIVISRTKQPERGSTVVAVFGANGDPILRIYMPRANGAIDLVPTHPDYETLTITSRTKNARILGRVIRHERDVL